MRSRSFMYVFLAAVSLLAFGHLVPETGDGIRPDSGTVILHERCEPALSPVDSECTLPRPAQWSDGRLSSGRGARPAGGGFAARCPQVILRPVIPASASGRYCVKAVSFHSGGKFLAKLCRFLI